MRSFKPIATKLSTATLQNTLELDPTIAQSVKPKFTLNELRKAIPEEAFQKSLPKSLFYMAFDYSMWGLAFAAIRALKESEIWTTLPFAAQAGASLLYWNVAGFFMWCIFVVGHDCGHGTFSNNKLLNNILGHITHGSILVPFFPWQLSHRRHHMFHNHIEKDYSYNWYTPDALKKPQEGVARHFHENKLLSFFLPFYGWFMYIFLGIRDGNHFIPFKNERLWKGTPKIEYIKCLISAAVVGLFGAANYYLFGQNLANMAFYYLAPLVMFGWWLVTVTYLQHHHEDSVVYDDSDWNFVDSAFETVDRKYGFGIDKLHHHITDGHVAHHLFYTLIPHYNLPVATKAIKSFLAKNGASNSYRFEKTYDFPFRVHRYLMDFGFKARRAHPSP
eukprot:CAMPEP_0173142474 /NCGR_PEP_ID=MMETSP1105-20130129/6105_1 /TAXON_ID=2985 /ORGANISM="Ochromonas sp., Strain BG-1" /LENGTH=388 /DNA_ID=CAMNT_0014055863 /DNA_START=50 /DNA_END=1216 /DNA_ORIENTATION=+